MNINQLKEKVFLKLQKSDVKILGSVRSDIEVFNAALYREPLGMCEAEKNVSKLIETLEQAL